jgi:hypothetical protein
MSDRKETQKYGELDLLENRGFKPGWIYIPTGFDQKCKYGRFCSFDGAVK